MACKQSLCEAGHDHCLGLVRQSRVDVSPIGLTTAFKALISPALPFQNTKESCWRSLCEVGEAGHDHCVRLVRQGRITFWGW
jgi:hypothetical protein